MSANGRRMAAVVRKELTTLTSYRVDLTMRLLHIGYFAVSFYFISEFVGDPESISQFRGGYFEFALIGAIVTSWAAVGMASFPDQISEEQNEGTLEAVLTTPTPIWTVLVASHAVAFAFVLAETILLVLVGLGLFGAGIPIAGMFRAAPILVLVALSFVPFGVISAAFVILVKRGNPFSGPAEQLTLLLSGALYPLSVLPGWLESLTRLVPATYGVTATRAVVQTDAGLTDVLSEIGVLIAFIVVALPLSMIAFRRAVGVAQRAGTLGTY